MRGGFGALYDFLRPGVRGLGHRIGEEEPLFRRPPCAPRTARGRAILLIRVERYDQSAQVRQVFAEREFAVRLDSGRDNYGAEKLFHDLGASVERLGIRIRPPILHVAVRVEVPALIVEPVRHLVPYDPAGKQISLLDAE